MSAQKYNIIFIGTPDFAVPTLEALIRDERFNVAAVITAPDAPVGRKQILTPPPVKVAAQKYGLKIFQPADIKLFPLAPWKGVQGVRVDVIITIAYGQIIPPEILNIPKFRCLNLHASLLPKYRGASPIQAAIAAGDKTTGVTLMKMDAGLDTGPIIAQNTLTIANDETGESLHDKLAQLSAGTLIKYLPDYLAGKIKPKPQNKKLASYAPKLTRQSGLINWRKPAVEIERLVRAYYPWPGTWMEWEGKILKIISVDKNISKINNYNVGNFFQNESRLLAQCGKDALAINKLQLEGKKVLTGKEFLQGYFKK